MPGQSGWGMLYKHGHQDSNAVTIGIAGEGQVLENGGGCHLCFKASLAIFAKNFQFNSLRVFLST